MLGFPTSCLRRHVGAPTGLNLKILLHAIMKIFWISVEQRKIMEAEKPTVWVGATPPELTHPHHHNPPHFTPDALPVATLRIYPGLGQAPIYAGLHTRWLVY